MTGDVEAEPRLSAAIRTRSCLSTRRTLLQKRRLGRTDLDIAPLVFGGNVFGWTADEKTSFDLLDRFVGAGLNAIDTADAYSRWVPGNKGGESETIIGKWMKEPRQPRPDRASSPRSARTWGRARRACPPRYIEKAVEASLKRLQTDVHRPLSVALARPGHAVSRKRSAPTRS